MKYVILCPANTRTGGPEACFQLSDALINQGFNAELWLFTLDDIADLFGNAEDSSEDDTFDVKHKLNVYPEYEKYDFKYFRKFSKKDDVTFILPEVLLTLVENLKGIKIIIWWLSVDYAFKALNYLNLNFLRRSSIRHFVQSKYAMEFTKSLGLSAKYLSDYTVLPAFDYTIKLINDRPMRVAYNAGKKSIADINLVANFIFKHFPNAEIIPIKDMDREEIYNVFLDSRLYIDLGNFPGKDRMPREALLLGCNILIGNAGAGSNSLDFPIEDIYKTDVFDYEGIGRKVAHMLTNSHFHSSCLESAKAKFSAEKQIFNQEVLALALGDSKS